MNSKRLFNSKSVIAAVTIITSLSSASAQVLFSDDFNTNSSSLWKINYAPAANANLQSAEFAFDYAYLGIPPAPGSSDTLGLRLRPNISGGAASPNNLRTSGVTSGLSVSPTNQNFGTSYTLSFYAWANFFGATNGNVGLSDNGNSQGGTANVLFAIGTSGTVPLAVGNTTLITDSTMDGVAFATTGDGGITSDYRAYLKSGTATITGPVLTAGSAVNTVAYYTNLFPAVSAPLEQHALATNWYATGSFDPMNGATQPGAFGFAWHKVDITKNNGFVTWEVDGVLLASSDISTLTLGGNNIAIGTSDVNATTARYPDLYFLLIDNLTVSTVPVPQIGSTSTSGNTFGFTVSGVSGQTVVVETSTNLINWSPVWTNILSGVSTNFTDAQWANYPARFYRAR